MIKYYFYYLLLTTKCTRFIINSCIRMKYIYNFFCLKKEKPIVVEDFPALVMCIRYDGEKCERYTWDCICMSLKTSKLDGSRDHRAYMVDSESVALV